MSELRKIYGLWYREVLRYWREKSRIVSSLILPLLWLLVFGSGLRGIQIPGGQTYQTYIFPGILEFGNMAPMSPVLYLIIGIP